MDTEWYFYNSNAQPTNEAKLIARTTSTATSLGNASIDHGRKKETNPKGRLPQEASCKPTKRTKEYKQSKTNSGEKIVQNKKLPTSPAITRNNKNARTQNGVDATTTTPNKHLFKHPSDSEEDEEQDSDDEAIEEETRRLKTLLRQEENQSDDDNPTHQGNQFRQLIATKKKTEKHHQPIRRKKSSAIAKTTKPTETMKKLTKTTKAVRIPKRQR
jgi:hypothetical protein